MSRTPRTQQHQPTEAMQTQPQPTLVPFDKNNEDHINMAKGLYYAWYGPKDAHEYLIAKGIEVSTSRLTQLFYNFRASKLPRADRAVQVEHYLSHIVEA